MIIALNNDNSFKGTDSFSQLKKLNWNLNDERFVVCVMPQWAV